MGAEQRKRTRLGVGWFTNRRSGLAGQAIFFLLGPGRAQAGTRCSRVPRSSLLGGRLACLPLKGRCRMGRRQLGAPALGRSCFGKQKKFALASGCLNSPRGLSACYIYAELSGTPPPSDSPTPGLPLNTTQLYSRTVFIVSLDPSPLGGPGGGSGGFWGGSGPDPWGNIFLCFLILA